MNDIVDRAENELFNILGEFQHENDIDAKGGDTSRAYDEISEIFKALKDAYEQLQAKEKILLEALEGVIRMPTVQSKEYQSAFRLIKQHQEGE